MITENELIEAVKDFREKYKLCSAEQKRKYWDKLDEEIEKIMNEIYGCE